MRPTATVNNKQQYIVNMHRLKWQKRRDSESVVCDVRWNAFDLLCCNNAPYCLIAFTKTLQRHYLHYVHGTNYMLFLSFFRLNKRTIVKKTKRIIPRNLTKRYSRLFAFYLCLSTCIFVKCFSLVQICPVSWLIQCSRFQIGQQIKKERKKKIINNIVVCRKTKAVAIFSSKTEQNNEKEPKSDR